MTDLEDAFIAPVLYSKPLELPLIDVLEDDRSTPLGEFSPVVGILDSDPDLDVTLGTMDGYCPVAGFEGLGLTMGLAFDADAVLGTCRRDNPIARHQDGFVGVGQGLLASRAPYQPPEQRRFRLTDSENGGVTEPTACDAAVRRILTGISEAPWYKQRIDLPTLIDRDDSGQMVG